MSDQQTTEQIAKNYEDAIRIMEPFISQEKDGTFSIRDGADVGLDPIIFADLKRSIEQTNRNVRAGLYRVGDTWQFSVGDQP